MGKTKLDELEEQYPGLKKAIADGEAKVDSQGNIHRLCGVGNAQNLPDEVKRAALDGTVDYCTRMPTSCGGAWIYGRVDNEADRKRFTEEMSKARTQLLSNSKWWEAHAALCSVILAWMKAGEAFRKVGSEGSVKECLKGMVEPFQGINWIMDQVTREAGEDGQVMMGLPKFLM